MTAPQFRCDEPEPSVWLWGGIICPAGQRPLFDQLVRRMLGLSPSDRARWLEQCRPRRGPHRRRARSR
jgi:hypothetical protein